MPFKEKTPHSQVKPAPPKLAELQDWLRAVWTEPRGIDAALDREPNLSGWIAQAPPIPVRTRLAVYSDAYFLRLLDCLSSDFSAVSRALGEQRFRELVAGYLQAHPSTSPNVSDLGAAFPAFLKDHPFQRELPFLADLARLDRAVFESLYSTRLGPFDPETINNAPAEAWSNARLILDPTVRLLDLGWPVEPFWRRQECAHDKRAPVPRRPQRQCLLVFRDDEWVRVEPLSAAAWTVLVELQCGKSLEQACAAAQAARLRVRPAQLSAWFARWTASGVVKRVELL